MSINASVTLSIGELDSLRDNIKYLSKEVEDYKERERTVKIKVVEDNIVVVEDNIVSGIIEGPRDRYGMPSKTWGNIKTTIESYKNIDDIMEPLSQKAMEGVHKQLNSLNNQISIGTSKIADLEKKLREKTDELASVKADKEHKTLEEKLQASIKETKDIEKKLEQRIREIYLEKGDELKRYQQEVISLRSRKWYHLLFKKS